MLSAKLIVHGATAATLMPQWFDASSTCSKTGSSILILVWIAMASRSRQTKVKTITMLMSSVPAVILKKMAIRSSSAPNQFPNGVALIFWAGVATLHSFAWGEYPSLVSFYETEVSPIDRRQLHPRWKYRLFKQVYLRPFAAGCVMLYGRKLIIYEPAYSSARPTSHSY